MQNNDPLYELVRFVTSGTKAAAASPNSSAADAAAAKAVDAASQTAGQLQALRSLFQGQIDSTAVNTRAISDDTKTREQSSGSSSAGSIAKSVATVVTGGFMLSPILSGLMKLFGGGRSEDEPAPLQKFAMPAPLSINAGIAAGTPGFSSIDYGQTGAPRTVAGSAPTQVTVQVNAMDSRSFMDHSEDIANAVRRAMLESSSLNDVVSEL